MKKSFKEVKLNMYIGAKGQGMSKKEFYHNEQAHKEKTKALVKDRDNAKTEEEELKAIYKLEFDEFFGDPCYKEDINKGWWNDDSRFGPRIKIDDNYVISRENTRGVKRKFLKAGMKLFKDDIISQEMVSDIQGRDAIFQWICEEDGDITRISLQGTLVRVRNELNPTGEDEITAIRVNRIDQETEKDDRYKKVEFTYFDHVPNAYKGEAVDPR
jgi:hypothetical protein